MIFDGGFWCPPMENDMRLCKLGALIKQADAKLALTQTQFFRTPGVRIVSILKEVVKEGYKKDEIEESQLYKTLEKYNKKASDIENKYFKLKQGALVLITQHKFSINSTEYNYMIRLALAASSGYQDVCANLKNVLRDIDVRGSQNLKTNMFSIVTHINLLLTELETEAKTLSSASQSSSVNSYDLKNKIKVEDSSLIKWLKQKTGLPFFCVRDENYKVDAISDIGSKDAQIAFLKLQESCGVGRFFNEVNGKRLFVLEEINIHDIHPTAEERIRDYLLCSH
jgi:hypothetical protein